MLHIYYIEVNVICIILLSIIFDIVNQNKTITSASQRALSRLIIVAIILCLADAVAGICRGKTFRGVRVLIEVSNLVYIEMIPIISILWYTYVCQKINKQIKKINSYLLQIPLIVLTLIALSNPITEILFSIDANNLYMRGPGVYIHWIVSWFYLAYSWIISIKAYKSSDNWLQRDEYSPLLFFFILPAIGSIIQMLFYGITSVQVGIALSIVFVCAKMRDDQISIDELTGINNRRSLVRYVDFYVLKKNSNSTMVMMLDINHFKSINDNFGHLVGDIALCSTANILRDICLNFGEQLFLCRYGGDEFVIIGQDMDKEKAEALENEIHRIISVYTNKHKQDYKLELSIGYAIGQCDDMEDFKHFLRLSDENMYHDKKNNRLKVKKS